MTHKDETYTVAYRADVNKKALSILAAHLPLMLVASALFKNGFWLALLLSVAFIAVAAGAFLINRGSVVTSCIIAGTIILFSALLIHLGHGMIEMHFHIFAMLGLMILFGTGWPLVVAAAVTAIHHVLFYFVLPNSILAHCTSFWVIVIHALFVVAEVVPGVWIANRFGNFIRAQGIATSELDASVGEIGQAAVDVNSAGSHFSEQVLNQSQSLTELSNSTSEIDHAAEQNAASSAKALATARSVAETIEKANGGLSELQNSMQSLFQVTGNIEKLVAAIDGIAFQTNILALNAAVEAARAGEAGSGFAVVADEVRSLAQRSAQSAKDTSLLISQCAESTRTSSTTLENLNSLFRLIMEGGSELKKAVEDVSAASSEQANELKVVFAKIRDIEQSNEATRTTAERNASAADSLMNRSQGLQELVSSLKSVIAA